jgi:hypothetical protein
MPPGGPPFAEASARQAIQAGKRSGVALSSYAGQARRRLSYGGQASPAGGQTSRTAYDKGYGVTIMKDAIAVNSEEEQNHAEAKIFPLLGQTLSVDQFLEQLEE